MPQEKTVESIISGFTASILREHFGKGPSSVYVTIYKSFVCIQVRDFLAPMERILLDQNEKNRVLKTRDLLMVELMAEFSGSKLTSMSWSCMPIGIWTIIPA